MRQCGDCREQRRVGELEPSGRDSVVAGHLRRRLQPPHGSDGGEGGRGRAKARRRRPPHHRPSEWVSSISSHSSSPAARTISHLASPVCPTLLLPSASAPPSTARRHDPAITAELVLLFASLCFPIKLAIALSHRRLKHRSSTSTGITARGAMATLVGHHAWPINTCASPAMTIAYSLPWSGTAGTAMTTSYTSVITPMCCVTSADKADKQTLLLACHCCCCRVDLE